jgi:hypothetical protein
VLQFLAQSGEEGLSGGFVPTAGLRRWDRTLAWLDGAGLSLYFLEALTKRNMAGSVPRGFLDCLEDRKRCNQERISRIGQTFAILNHRFAHEGVEYAALKGFSLVPDYCPDASLRGMSDLDYLITASSLQRAQRVLAERGYVLKKQTAEEFAFWIPSAEPVRDIQIFSVTIPFAIELHLSVWNSSFRDFYLDASTISANRVQIRRFQGGEYRALRDPEGFLVQVLHAFRHLMDGCLKPSWLLELSQFLRGRKHDEPFWRRVGELVPIDFMVPEMIGFIARMASQMFETPIPEPVVPWAEQVHPAAQFWIKQYARNWFIESGAYNGLTMFPPTKLSLFLKEIYGQDARHQAHRKRRALYPWQGLRHVAKPSKWSSRTKLGGAGQRLQWIASRLVYHATTGARYWCELPRWRSKTRRTAVATSRAGAGQNINRSRYPNGRLPT